MSAPTGGCHIHYCTRDGHEWLCHGIACARAARRACEKHKS